MGLVFLLLFLGVIFVAFGLMFLDIFKKWRKNPLEPTDEYYDGTPFKKAVFFMHGFIALPLGIASFLFGVACIVLLLIWAFKALF